MSRKSQELSSAAPEAAALSASRSSFQVEDLKAYLRGRWKLQRQIGDARRGQQGCFGGEVVFVEKNSGLHYLERGRMDLPDYQGEASQSYFFAFLEHTVAQVHFEDGRLFHSLDLSCGEWNVEYLCGKDVYLGRFSVQGSNLWQSVWSVSGPRKDLILETVYSRIAP